MVPLYSTSWPEGSLLLHLQFILCDKLKVKPVEVREITVPAADREVPAPDYDVMRTGCFTVPALCCTDQFPRVVASDLGECARPAHILDSWDKDAGRAAVVASDLCFIGNCLDDLVRHLFTVVAIGAVGQKDKPVAHVMYLHVGIYECVARPVRAYHRVPSMEKRPPALGAKKKP
jgi:hypothetical protein